MKEQDPQLARKLRALDTGRNGDLDAEDEPQPPAIERFIPWHKQMRGKKLTPLERERMDQLGKKAVPRRRIRR